VNNRLQLQLFFVLLSAVSVAALSVLLISQAVRSAESAVLADTRQALAASAGELSQQLDARIASDTSWATLPASAREISLRGISQTVLRSYPGVEGGFFLDSALSGYSFPTHDSGSLKIDLPVAERDEILFAVQEASRAGAAFRLIRGSRDLVAIDAHRYPNAVAWSMKRLAGLNDPDARRRTWLLAALVIAALFSVTGTVTTAFGLRRGIADIQQGLTNLKSDFAFELPARRDELGEISSAINTMAGIRRRLEGELRREDRLKTIGRLTANLAHEIRNPLNSIRLSMQSLEMRLNRNTAKPEDVSLVILEVDRLNVLLSQLLAFGNRQPAQLVKQPIAPLVWRCVQMLNPEAVDRDITFVLACDNPDAVIEIDAPQITQALTNLLLNALQASASGAPVAVDIRCGDRLTIEVRDSGPGIASDQREHLFEAFYTTKPNGTGLGLAVSRELVDGMGGRIFLRDSGPGATFVMEFPYAR